MSYWRKAELGEKCIKDIASHRTCSTVTVEEVIREGLTGGVDTEGKRIRCIRFSDGMAVLGINIIYNIIKQVASFKYIESIIKEDMKYDQEVKIKIGRTKEGFSK